MSEALVRHAVVEDNRIVTIAQNERKLCARPIPSLIRHVSQLWNAGQKLGISHFWVMPGSTIDLANYTFLQQREGYNVFVPLTEKAERPRGARCWKEQTEGGTHQIVVFYPAREPFSWTVTRPLDVLASVDYLTQVLHLPIQWSPQSIGAEFLREKYKTDRLQSLLRDGTIDQAKLPFRRAAPEIIFKQPLLLSMVGKYVIVIDKDAAHPAAASSMYTGVGDPEHLTFDTFPWQPPEKGEHRLPGIYRVSVKDTGASIFDGRTLPLIVASEWITLDVLLYALKQGYSVDVHEAHIFRESYRLFDEWARDLWKARQDLKDEQRFPYAPGRLNAYATLKDIMNRTISSLRRNWWADMVGAARVGRLANLEKFAESGHYPVLIYYDDIAFVGDDPDPNTVLPGGMLARTEGIGGRTERMGGYKHKYSLQLTEEMIAEYNQLPKAGQALTFLKKTAQAKGLIK